MRDLENQSQTGPTILPDCDACGGDLCPHGICRDNWCGRDLPCQECSDRRRLEQEAEANFNYYNW
jgi:hypothetical protein